MKGKKSEAIGDLANQRSRLVEYISGFAVKRHETKDAFNAVRRENFMPPNMRQYAYADDAIPIWNNQTISQPSTISIMLELLEVKQGMNVLEVGSGGGYVLALLSKMVGADGKVYGVEISEELFEKSSENLAKEGIANAIVRKGDGANGWKENAPFDRVLVSCACPFIPKELFNELKEGGRIVAPVGDQHTQVMEIMMKVKGKPMKKSYEGTLFAFVPLKGRHGFK
ncbi:MAG TPA: protein-L-isoaspartate(D-aspartate) O-methyltransferase [archaeon]|nr:protein-L-isoaspartate(D-aspartate) O-methyltransferase [archaeon]